MAASKVNVKFVVLLSAVLGMVFVGVALSFVYIKLKSGDRYARLAEAAMAAGDYKKADLFWSRAVGKDQSRVDWLVKWRDTRRKKVPENNSAYLEEYQMYVSILRTLANAKRPPDVELHRAYLDELYLQASSLGFVRESWRRLITETEAGMRFFEPDHPAALRRYRGIAIVSLAAIREATGADVSESEFAVARDDLEAALKANPADETAANDLAVWHRDAAKVALAAENRDKAMAELAESRKPIDALLAASPENPFGLVAKVTLDVSDIDLLTDRKQSPAELMKIRTAALDSLRPRIKELGDKLAATDPAKLKVDTLSRYVNLAVGIDPKDGPGAVMRVINRAMEAGKDDPELVAMRCQLLSMAGDAEGAIAQYQAIIDAPRKPVGWDGFRQADIRRAAMFQQTNLAMAMALSAKDETDRKAALARVDKFRKQLASNVAEHAPELLLIDAKVKYLEGDLRGSQRLVSEFVKTPGTLGGQVPQARMLASDIAQRLGQVGLAIEELEKVRPANPDILVKLAEMYSQVQQSGKAAALYTQALEMDPDNAQAKKGLQVAKAIEEGPTSKLDDPVDQLLVEAERVRRGTSQKLGDEQAALDILEKGIATTGADPRVVIRVAWWKATTNDIEGAKTALKTGLAKHPDDAQMKEFLSRLESTATLEGVLAMIDAQPGEPAEKLWAKHQAYLTFDKQPEAATALEDMAKLVPKDSRVIEAQFLTAIRNNQLSEAQRLTDLAVDADADRAEGDSYRARLLLAKGELKEAAALLERATQRGNSTAPLLRLLGVVQLQLGQDQGLTAIKQALDLNPTDLTTIKMYLSALQQLNRRPEALALARESQRVAQRDPEFLSAWLALESAAGNRAFAVERREQIYKRSPSDVTNGVALADLYMDSKDWDKARALLDTLRPGNETDVRITNANARWHADKNDLEGARQAFITLIEEIGKKLPAGKELPPAPYLAFGQFMLQRGKGDWGLAALRQAERLQDPKTMDVSLILGEVLLNEGMFADAEVMFRKMIDAKVADPRHEIRKRLIEAYVQQRKLEEAEKEFVALGAAADDDVEMMAQRSHAARGLGDLKRAREILDRAVVKFPNEALPYVRRARLLMLDPSTVKDALADLDTAIKLKPAMWQARRTRATLLMGQGQIDDGIKDFMAAVESVPAMDSLRLELISTLLTLGREPEAMDVADAGLKLRPNDVRLIGSIGDRFAGAQPPQWARAVRFYKMLWLQLGDEASAIVYVNALLSSASPALAEAEAVLNTPALNTDRSASLLMARAALRKKQGREEDAKKDALAAFDRSIVSPATLNQWAQRLRKPFPDARAALAVLRAAQAPAGIADWLTLQQGKVMLEDATLKSEGVSLLEGLLANSADRDVKIEVCRELPGAYVTDKKWQEALDVSRKGLEFLANDVMFSNNTAYFLSEGLNNPKDALIYAERAAQLAPNNDQILDTLANVNWRLGNRDKAMQIEMEAFRKARSEADKATWALTLARWKLETKDKSGATGLLVTLREMLSDSPTLGAGFKSKVDQLEKDIQGAP